MMHTSDGQSALVPHVARTYRTTSGTHYSSIREPQVALGTRPTVYQAQPITFRPLVQDPVVMTDDQWLQVGLA